MEKKINKLEHCHTEVEVKVDTEAWKKAQEKSFEKLAKEVTVKGFRKGNAPLNLVKDKVDPMKVMDDAINAILPEIYTSILKEDGIVPFARPDVQVTKVSDTELELKFVLVTAPEVKLGQYKGLKVGKEKVEVTDKDVEAELVKVQENSAMLMVKEGPAELGDTVVMDFVGSVDGKEFEGGSATNYELELGSHSFVPGFEEQLVGVKAGESKNVNIKFPENYVENLKGKDAVFAVTVHEVKEKKLPELNDELVKDLKIEGVETVEQLKVQKRDQLTLEKERKARNEYMGKLLSEIAKNSTIEIPEEIINNQAESMKKDAENRMAQSGLKLDQYLQIIGQTEEQFMANLKEQATKDATNYFIIDEISKAENITVSDEDLEFEFAKMADQYKMKVEDVKKALAPQLEEFRNNVRMNRVDDLLYKEND